MEVVQLDYVTCVKVEEGKNFGTADNAQRTIVAAKQTTLFEAEDKASESKQAKKSGQPPLQQRKISGQGANAKSLLNRYHGRKDG